MLSISKAILVLWLALWPAAALAQAPPPPAVTPAEAQRALDVLQDPAKRAQLVETLQAIAKAQPAHSTPTETEPTLAPGSLGAQLLAQSSRWTDRLAEAAATAAASMTAFPSLLRGLRENLSDPTELTRLGQSVWRAVLVLVLALLLEWLTLRGLRRPLVSILAHAPDREPEAGAVAPEALPDPSDVSPPVLDDALAERHRSARAGRHLRRLPFALAWLLLELLPVAVFAAAGTILAGTIVTSPTARLVTLALVNAYAIGRAIVCAGRMLIAPGRPGLRLLPIGDGAAAYLLRWLRLLVVIALFGNAFAEAVYLLGADRGAHDTLGRLTALVVALPVRCLRQPRPRGRVQQLHPEPLVVVHLRRRCR